MNLQFQSGIVKTRR